MNIFDILGPIMIGPSSSHTAGAVKIGYISRLLLEDELQKAAIILHGSFADTGRGHGTDRAMIAGLLGMKPDDERIPQSFEIAQSKGVAFSFTKQYIKDAHPNTAKLELFGVTGSHLTIQAASIGGGRVEVQKIDSTQVVFSAEKPTIVVKNQDTPGHVAKVTSLLADYQINIGNMQLYRSINTDYAMMVIETDQRVEEEILKKIRALTGIFWTIYLNLEE